MMTRYMNSRRRAYVQTIKRILAVTTALCGSVFAIAIPASAQTSARIGTISSVFLSGGNNYPFRVTLSKNGNNPMSDCKGSFAYVTINNDNYQAYVAALTTLYVRATPVTLTITPDGNGFCQLIEFGSA